MRKKSGALRKGGKNFTSPKRAPKPWELEFLREEFGNQIPQNPAGETEDYGEVDVFKVKIDLECRRRNQQNPEPPVFFRTAKGGEEERKKENVCKREANKKTKIS